MTRTGITIIDVGMDAKNAESPAAAALKKAPILCARCVALAGCSIAHQTMNALAIHPRIVLSDISFVSDADRFMPGSFQTRQVAPRPYLCEAVQ
jgi:hypothetical protein